MKKILALAALSLALSATASAGPTNTAGSTSSTTRPTTTQTTTGTTAGLPRGWPKDVPIYTGATILEGSGKAKNLHVTMTSGATCQAVLKWYKKKIKGLNLQSETSETLIFTNLLAGRTVTMACTPGKPSLILIDAIDL
jgi:hypothetical protein